MPAATPALRSATPHPELKFSRQVPIRSAEIDISEEDLCCGHSL